MKRTKNMIYKETEESRELFLYTINDGEIYKTQTTAIINNLKKKYNRGLYDQQKAVDAFYYLACTGSEKYNRDFGYSFSVGDRFTAAVEFEQYYKDHIMEG